MRNVAPYGRNSHYGGNIQSKVLRGGEPGSRPQRRLRPISRGQPGYVYSKKMTLGCNPSSSSGKLRTKKKRGGASVGGNRGVPEVRSLLPWWQHAASKVGADMNREEHVFGQGGTDQDDTAPALKEHSSPQQSVGSRTPEKPADSAENQLSGASGRTTVSPSGVDTVHTVQNKEDGQQGTSDYTHYANLFDNPPPSIPPVDQYVFNDNVMYEAITKRGHTQALPLSPSSRALLGIDECSTAPRGAAPGGEEVRAHMDPSALLYADEDIDKARKPSG